MTAPFRLHGFFASGTSYRLRIALNLKGIPYEYVPVNLRTEEHSGEDYKTLNPQGLVPTLETPEGLLIQSPAIIEWLDETYPEPAFLPGNATQRAHIRAMADIVGCDIHPVNNRRILVALRKRFGCDEDGVNDWCGQWIHDGFSAIEALLAADPARKGFCFGSAPTLADIFLVPQVFSARRFKVDLTAYPRILEVDATCNALKAFADAAPSKQPDFEKI